MTSRWSALPCIGLLLGGLLLVVGPVGPATAAGSCTKSYVASGFSASAMASGFGQVVVTDPGVIADVDVRIGSSAGSPTEYWLEDPADATKSSQLTTSSGANLEDVTFDDEGTDGLFPGATPGNYTGRYQPLTPLAAFDGASTARTYRLRLDNHASSATATVSVWILTLTFGNCTTDTDNDGIGDAADACPQAAATTASGCPAVPTKAAIRYRKGKWQGFVEASNPACVAGRAVTLYRVRFGPDKRVGRATTNTKGMWRKKARPVRGRYYAVVDPKVVPGAECSAARAKKRLR